MQRSPSLAGATSEALGRIRSANGDPYLLLNLAYNATPEEARAAFRATMKAVHPDVLQGARLPSDWGGADLGDPARQVLEAYNQLKATGSQRHAYAQRAGAASNPMHRRHADSPDPFSQNGDRMAGEFSYGGTPFSGDPFLTPEGPATQVFVNGMRCTGERCSQPCYRRCPSVFSLSPETGTAVGHHRAPSRGPCAPELEYDLHLAQGQCPELCIHYVTPLQRAHLDGMLDDVLQGRAAVHQAWYEVECLLAKADYENGRRG